MNPFSSRSLAVLMAALAFSYPAPIPAASAAALPSPAGASTLEQAIDYLRQAWQRDPLTATRPFPSVRLVDRRRSQDCPRPRIAETGSLVVSCTDTGEILVDRPQLVALRGVFGEAAEAFAVAYGLAQSLISSPTPAAPVASATDALRAACAAGTLLAAMPIPDSDRRLLLNNAISAGEQAFPSSAAPKLGTGPQRAYALLSGMGGTPLDCSVAAMARLAGGAEPLEAFLATRGTSVGIDRFCRQPPACPRQQSVWAAPI
jgi:hypothetical protein